MVKKVGVRVGPMDVLVVLTQRPRFGPLSGERFGQVAGA
jgi:hypothetical protein